MTISQKIKMALAYKSMSEAELARSIGTSPSAFNQRMKEELEAEITAMEDEIKSVMGDEETLLAGAFKVSWKAVTSSRLDTTALKKAMPDIASKFMKQTTSRRFCIN